MRVGEEMTPIELATYYRENAAKCLLIAKRGLSTSERLALVDIAQAWTALAHHAEKNPQFFAVGEDLEREQGRPSARP